MPSTFLNNALVNAAKTRNLKAAQQALADGANPNAYGGIQRTPLFYAADNGDAAMAKLLLAHRALPDLLDEDDISPLHAAIEKEHFEVAEILLNAGADINIQGPDHKLAPLHTAIYADCASKEKRVQRVAFLLRHGADLERRQREGLNAIALAGALIRHWDSATRVQRYIASHTPEEKEKRRARIALRKIENAFHRGLSKSIEVQPIQLKKPAPGQ